MHDTAREFVRSVALALEGAQGPYAGHGLDLGGYDRNGSARELFPAVTWAGLDIEPGPGVDIVADARYWDPDTDDRATRYYDIVLCTELLEHVKGWYAVLDTAARAVGSGGVLVITAAGLAREPHTAAGIPKASFPPGEWPSEWYEGVQPLVLLQALVETGFINARVWRGDHDRDVYAMAWRP